MDATLAALFTLTLVAGPTVAIDVAGVRLLTDPTFDPAGTRYVQGPVRLEKTQGPALSPESLGHVDAVLLSHDEHRDNLDDAGRRFLARARVVLSTPAGAKRLGGHARGLAPWESTLLRGEGGARVRVTAVPAQHGPEGSEAFLGEVTGFVVQVEGGHGGALYVTGDTVWTERLADIGKRFRVDAVVLFAGAARVEGAGPVRLTLDARDAVRLVRSLGGSPRVFSAHDTGWTHVTQPPESFARALRAEGIDVLPLPAGKATAVPPPGAAAH
jgi:L-ascorbate metabolism protein UlaG (beta-lactamase superfamily)